MLRASARAAARRPLLRRAARALSSRPTYRLSEEQLALQETARQFARNELVDREGYYYLFRGSRGHRPGLHLMPEEDVDLKNTVISFNEKHTRTSMATLNRVKRLHGQYTSLQSLCREPKPPPP